MLQSAPMLSSPQEASCLAMSHRTLWWRGTFDLWSFEPRPSPTTSARGSSRIGLRHLLFHFLPGLVNIARGEMRFVGLEPRSPQEVKTMSDDWRGLYLRSKAGVITEASVFHGPDATGDDLYAAEVVYSVTSGVRHDAALLLRYAGRVLNFL